MHRRWTWLALLAMAFVVAMPSISRMLPMAAAAMPGMADASHDHHGANRHPDAPGQPADPLQHCGYCVLLAHSPVLGAGAMPLPTLAVPSPAMPVAADVAAVRMAPAWSASARGPPRTA